MDNSSKPATPYEDFSINQYQKHATRWIWGTQGKCIEVQLVAEAIQKFEHMLLQATLIQQLPDVRSDHR